MTKTYYDTSALIGLYVPEDFTGALAAYVGKQGRPILIHDLHVLETENGLRAKVFRKEMTSALCEEVLRRFRKDIASGLLAPVVLNWKDVFREACRVSSEITARSGCRSLDMLHIGAARHWNCSLFVSLDDRQLKAASLARLKVLDIRRA